MEVISFAYFEKIMLVAGTIVEADAFPEARKPAYKLKVSLGEYGVRQTSAQLTGMYSPEALVGRRVICVINFPPKKIAGYTSEILVTGFYNDEGKVVLASIDGMVPDGARLC